MYGAEMHLLILVACFVAGVVSQKAGTVTPETHLPLTISVCSGPGNCQQESGNVVMDVNWRWVHTASGYDSCRVGDGWDSTICPDPDTCTANCVVEGVTADNWKFSGVSTSGNAARLNFITQTDTGKNVGSRFYLLDPSGTKYRMFRLLNQELAFDVDVSTLECGMNGALYLIGMDEDGGTAKYPTNTAGAKYGTGYCDAQCGHGSTWAAGKANSAYWSDYGTCCAEFDLWEANKFSTVYTSHPCTIDGYYPCQGTPCGDNSERYNGVCDKDGCGFNSYRLGEQTFYGPGSQYKVDTTKPVTVVTQFVTSDGTSNGDLKEIRRLYVQNGQVIENSKVNVNGIAPYDSISDQYAADTTSVFGGLNYHSTVGGVKRMGEALRQGMALVFSLWDDRGGHMLWMDSLFPTDADPSKPGVLNGPCPTDSGDPDVIEVQYPDAYVTFSNIKVGPIGSTY